jgi:hypothetical protein
MNELFVQGYIRSFADLRGRKLVVDAPNTAYAIQAKKILQKHGLKDGTDYTVVPVGRGELRLKAMAENRDYAAAILNLPFTIQAEQLGMKSLGNTVDILGPYQANGALRAARLGRSRPAARRYIAAYVESLRWVGSRKPRRVRGDSYGQLKINREVANETTACSSIRCAGSLRSRFRRKASGISSRCAPDQGAAPRSLSRSLALPAAGDRQIDQLPFRARPRRRCWG